MKKLFSVLLAALLAVSMTACGKKEPAPAPSESPLPSPPAQEAPQDEVKEDKSNLDPFEIEAVTLAECLVAAIDDLDDKTNKPEYDYDEFFLKLAAVEDDDFTYYGLAPLDANGKLNFIPERCEVIAYQIFGKEISINQIFDDDDYKDAYDKDKNIYVLPAAVGLDGDYMAQNLKYTPSDDQTSCVVTFDLLKEVNDDGDPVFKEIGKGNIRFKLSSEKGGAYWTYDGFTLV